VKCNLYNGVLSCNTSVDVNTNTNPNPNPNPINEHNIHTK